MTRSSQNTDTHAWKRTRQLLALSKISTPADVAARRKSRAGSGDGQTLYRAESICSRSEGNPGRSSWPAQYVMMQSLAAGQGKQACRVMLQPKARVQAQVQAQAQANAGPRLLLSSEYPQNQPSGRCSQWPGWSRETDRYVIVDREINDAAGPGWLKEFLSHGILHACRCMGAVGPLCHSGYHRGGYPAFPPPRSTGRGSPSRLPPQQPSTRAAPQTLKELAYRDNGGPGARPPHWTMPP